MNQLMKKKCPGFHCKCMNINNQCQQMHYADCWEHNPDLSKSNFEERNEEAEASLKKINEMLNQIVPDGMGFTFLLFDYGEKGNMFYISSADREDTIMMIEEFIERQKKP